MRRRGRERSSRRDDLETRRIRWIEDLVNARRRGAGDARTSRLPLVGIGDDAAVWAPSRGRNVVLTVDAQVEGTHFRRPWLAAREIGRRAASAAISDLAAMAASPACLLVSLVLEKGTPERDFQGIFLGIEETAREHGARIIGGNLSSGPLAVHITAIGEVASGGAILRSGSSPGEEIWVTGAPGLARLGLLALDRRSADSVRHRARNGTGAVEQAVRAYRRPDARVPEAQEVARSWRPSAMIDLSDGLAADLRHVLGAASDRLRRALGAEIDEAALRLLPGLEPAARALGESPTRAALLGGEDYELLFTTAPRGSSTGRALAFQKKMGVPLTLVGRTIDAPDILLRKLDGTRRRITEKGWSHWNRRSR